MLCCFFSVLTFLHLEAFILFSNCLSKHACQADCSFLHVFPQIHKPCFSGSLLRLLLHDPYRKFTWQERKRLYTVKEQGYSQPRAVIQKALGGRWPASHENQSGVLSEGESSSDGCLQRLQQGWPQNRGCGCGCTSGGLRASRCERPSLLPGSASPSFLWERCFIPPSTSFLLGEGPWLCPHAGLSPPFCG